MKKAFLILKHILQFIFLTLLTQIGGVVYLFSQYIQSRLTLQSNLKKTIVFIAIYILFTFLIVPFIAPIFGREAIKHSNKIQPTNYFTVILNRNYVRPQMNLLLANTEKELSGTNIHINYLDANFPFINGFPLLPHLSHNDGKKLDISLVYKNSNGTISTKQKSFTGYGVFEEPTSKEFNQIDKCKTKGYFQYDYPKYVKISKINKELTFSKKGNKQLINAILNNNRIGKLFIEPHLKNRLGLTNSKIRYHGCKAVRHDDHIHIQLK